MTPEALRATRKRCGLSQAELARRLDVHVMTVSRWERGVRPIMPLTERAIRYVLLAALPVSEAPD